MKKKVREEQAALDRKRRAYELEQRWSGPRLQRAIIGWLAMPLVVLIIAGMAPLLPGLFCMLSALVIFAIIVHPSEEVKGRRLEVALWSIFILPWLVAGFLVPFRLLAVLLVGRVIPITYDDAHKVFEPMAIDMILGIAGTVLAFGGGLYALGVLRTQLRQTENLPTSKAGAAAIGLAEFHGVVRRAPSQLAKIDERGVEAILPAEHILCRERFSLGSQHHERTRWQRFFLEDASGRILIEPHGVEFWDLRGSSPVFQSVRKIALSKRLKKHDPDEWDETLSLQEGDKVYVVGSVEMLPDREAGQAVDSGRLVVRPSTEKVLTGWWDRLLFPAAVGRRFRKGREFRHIFLLTDSDEVNARGLLDTAMRGSLFLSGSWLIASLWLMMLVLRAQGR